MVLTAKQTAGERRGNNRIRVSGPDSIIRACNILLYDGNSLLKALYRSEHVKAIQENRWPDLVSSGEIQNREFCINLLLERLGLLLFGDRIELWLWKYAISSDCSFHREEGLLYPSASGDARPREAFEKSALEAYQTYDELLKLPKTKNTSIPNPEQERFQCIALLHLVLQRDRITLDGWIDRAGLVRSTFYNYQKGKKVRPDTRNAIESAIDADAKGLDNLD